MSTIAFWEGFTPVLEWREHSLCRSQRQQLAVIYAFVFTDVKNNRIQEVQNTIYEHPAIVIDTGCSTKVEYVQLIVGIFTRNDFSLQCRFSLQETI